MIQKLAKLFVQKKLLKPKIKKESKDHIIKSIRNHFNLEKENKVIKDKIISDIRNLLELENQDYCKQIRVGNLCSSNYIEHESNGDRDKNLSIEAYLNKIKQYLKDIIIDLQTSNSWKIQLTTAINFFVPKITTKNEQSI